MLEKSTYSFLQDLASNNNKTWFNANRESYKAAKLNFEGFVEKLLTRMVEFDQHLYGLKANECIFRIYRDVRFLKNNPPYKTHFSAYIALDGRNSDFAGYYLQVKPSATILGGGMYKPGSAVLRKIRQEIDYNAGPLKEIIDNPKFKSLFGEINGDRLPNAPVGFPRDHKDIDLLKLISYFLVHKVDDDALTHENAIDYTIDVYKEVHYFNKFFNETFVS